MTDGYGLPLRSPLFRVGDWLTDTVHAAHISLPLWAKIAAALPTGRDGMFRLGAAGITYVKAVERVGRVREGLAALYRADLVAAKIVERVGMRKVDINDPNAMIANQPWRVQHPERDDVLLTFDGRILSAAALPGDVETVADWRLCRHGTQWLMVGVTGRGVPRLFLPPQQIPAPEEAHHARA